MTNVTINNDPTYLFISWLGWDYNFWTMIFGSIILMIIFFGTVFLLGFIGMLLGLWGD